MKRFADKTVLVTGAVRNTGRAIAEAFAAEGAALVLNSRNADDVKRVAAEIRNAHGARVIEAPADVADHEAVCAMFDAIGRQVASLDALVNNAILQGCGHTFTDTPPDLLQSVFAVNVFGSFYCAQQAARMMKEHGGAIVNVGSNVAFRAIRQRAAYVASKGAIDALTRALAVELGPDGIRVNSVAAGYIRTDRWEGLTDVADRRRANVPLGCESIGRQIAEAVMFLASDAASSTTGACLTVDGGITAQLLPMDCDA
jgi:NAD(P)-dependent dehydrogenase (short-subunit alcohol dehydrogenase family)